MPMPTNPSYGMSPAVNDLGLGNMLADQVAGETAEERKKRMQQMQQSRMAGSAGSPATLSLLGGGLASGT